MDAAPDAAIADAGSDAGLPDDAGAPDGGPCVLSQSCLQAELDSLCTEQGTLGAVLGVQTADGTRFVAACGHADLARTTPLDVGDRFRVASITKTFMSALLLTLAEDGMLALSDTVGSLGITADGADAITVRHLLGHGSGLVDFNSEASFDWDRTWTIPEVIAWVTDGYEPRFAPGTGFLYCGTGYLIASEIAASITSGPYASALRARFFEPLGLDDTFVEDAEPIPDGFVEGSLLEGGSLRAPLEDVLWPSADAAVVSNAADLLDWFDHLFMARDVLSEESLAAMTMPVRLADGSRPAYPGFLRGSEYGLGLAIEDAPEGPIYWHGGLNWGFLSRIAAQPATGRAVVVLLNTENVDETAFSALGWELLRR